MGLAQHHDGVSGTSKQHVADDYARHLHEGIADCDVVMSNAISHLVSGLFSP
jgi:lysosomal alpha-mannosidase